MDVQRLAAPELLLEYSGNCLVRLVHVREHGVAAAGWRLDRVEKSVPVRPRRVTAVDVEPELAFPEGADRLAVDLDVGDEENLLIVLLAPLGAAAQLIRRLLAVAQCAEIGGEPKLVILRKSLAAEHQHKMPVPGVLDGLNCRGRERPGEVDPLDLSAAGRGQGRDLDADDI